MKSLTELDGLTTTQKLAKLMKHSRQRDARALANDSVIMEYFTEVDISDIAHLCEVAGKNSYEYWTRHKGAKQCSNSLHSSTAGMYGEAIAERWLTQLGVTAKANWWEWVDGVANDSKADIEISGIMDAREIEVKTITKATDPKGQVTVYHLEKYVREEKLIMCVRYDETKHVGYVYALAESGEVLRHNQRELNLNYDDCYVVMPASSINPTESIIDVRTGEHMPYSVQWR